MLALLGFKTSLNVFVEFESKTIPIKLANTTSYTELLQTVKLKFNLTFENHLLELFFNNGTVLITDDESVKIMFEVFSKTKTSQIIIVKIKKEETKKFDHLLVTLGQFYENIEFIDKGGYGTVYRAVSLKNHQQVALKILHQTNTEEVINEALREALTTIQLDHPNIIKVFNAQLVNYHLIIEMECLQENLFDKFIKQKIQISEKLILEILLQLSDALRYLKEKRIVHRDIKLQNILIKKFESTLDNLENIQVVLTDFGFAKSNQSKMSLAGTEAYLAIELADDSSSIDIDDMNYSFSSDIFALGVTFYRLITFDCSTGLGRSFFLFENEKNYLELIKKKILHFSKSYYSNELIELIIEMLRIKENRITCDKLFDITKKLYLKSLLKETFSIDGITSDYFDDIFNQYYKLKTEGKILLFMEKNSDDLLFNKFTELIEKQFKDSKIPVIDFVFKTLKRYKLLLKKEDKENFFFTIFRNLVNQFIIEKENNLLLIYYNDLFRRKNSLMFSETLTELIFLFEQILQVFDLLTFENKIIFINKYIHSSTKRILYYDLQNRTFLELLEKEIQFIELLYQYFSKNKLDTTKIELLKENFKDFRTSSKLTLEFNNSLKVNETEITELTKAKVNFFICSKTNFCRATMEDNFQISQSYMNSLCNQFEHFLKSKENFKGRKLEWLSSESTMTLTGLDFTNGNVIVDCPLATGLILLLFNNFDRLTLNEIESELNLSNNHKVKKSLSKLMKLKLLINKDNNYQLNNAFTGKIRIQNLELNDTTDWTVEKKFVVDEAIIKTMLHRRVLNGKELYEKVVERLAKKDIVISEKEFKRRVEDLIVREYLERDSKDLSVYHYVA